MELNSMKYYSHTQLYIYKIDLYQWLFTRVLTNLWYIRIYKTFIAYNTLTLGPWDVDVIITMINLIIVMRSESCSIILIYLIGQSYFSTKMIPGLSVRSITQINLNWMNRQVYNLRSTFFFLLSAFVTGDKNDKLWIDIFFFWLLFMLLTFFMKLQYFYTTMVK